MYCLRILHVFFSLCATQQALGGMDEFSQVALFFSSCGADQGKGCGRRENGREKGCTVEPGVRIGYKFP